MGNFRKNLVIVGLLASLAAFCSAQEPKVLTNKDVADMAKEGLGETVIIKVIQASDTNFDLSAAGLDQLQNSGISPNILSAMIKASTKGAPDAMAAANTSGAATAEPAVSPAAPAATANQGKYLLKEGTEVPLKFANDLSSKTASDGDRIEMVLDGDLKVDGVVVAKDGTHAVAVVSNAKKAGMMGKPGELNIQLEHMVAGDNRIRLRGTKGREGESKTGTAVALTVLFGPIGLIKHGKNVEVKAGTPLTAFVDEDIWLPLEN
jgi:hypothetical protein